MYVALTLLRAWNNGTVGFSAVVVHIVNRWIDGGMNGPIPWPNDPFFEEWAKERGFSRIGDYVGFRCEMQMSERGGE